MWGPLCEYEEAQLMEPWCCPDGTIVGAHKVVGVALSVGSSVSQAPQGTRNVISAPA